MEKTITHRVRWRVSSENSARVDYARRTAGVKSLDLFLSLLLDIWEQSGNQTFSQYEGRLNQVQETLLGFTRTLQTNTHSQNRVLNLLSSQEETLSSMHQELLKFNDVIRTFNELVAMAVSEDERTNPNTGEENPVSKIRRRGP